MTLRDSIDRTSMHKLAIGGAWFFIAVSSLYLIWAASMLMSGATGSAALYTALHDGQSVGAIGLSYFGGFGLALVLLESLLLGAAVVATVLRIPKWRRIGHATLVAWAGLWALNLAWLASIDPSFIGYGQSLTMTTLLGFTIYRAMRGWNVPARRMTFHEGPAAKDAVVVAMHEAANTSSMNFEAITDDDISHSDAVRELQREQSAPKSKWKRVRQPAAQFLQRCWAGFTAIAMRLWPHAQTVGVNFWKVVKAQIAALSRWMRGKGVLPRKTTTSATVQT